MKRFIFKIVLFFTLIAIVDIVFGHCFDFLRGMACGGITYKNEYIANSFKDDILILGSSRAVHHYISSVVEDTLQMTCYNAGEEGCGIIPAYIRYKLAKENRNPKLVIYEVTPSFDYFEEKGGYSKYLGVIRQYGNYKLVKDDYLEFSDDLEELRLFSSLYRNNSKMVSMFFDIISEPDINMGYIPLYGKMQKSIDGKAPISSGLLENKIDLHKSTYLEQFIVEAKSDGVMLIFTVSPMYGKGNSDLDYKHAYNLCKKYNVPFINNMNSSQFNDKIDLFQDKVHLNNDGALLYSKLISKQIKSIMNN